MTRCIIHIGMHKTGSTSIQNSLSGLNDERFLYAQLGLDPNHSLAIYSLFATQPERHQIHRAERRDAAAIVAYNKRMLGDLERAISSARGRTLLISGEDIIRLPPPDVTRLHSYFQRHFDKPEVVGYVRPPAEFMASAFQQRVKGGSLTRFDPSRVYRKYEDTFSKFDKSFGRECVHLWKYDPESFPGRCAVQDFCSRLGISIAGGRIVRLNDSLPRQAVALLYTYRRLGQKYGSRTMRAPEGQRLGNLMAGIGNGRFRFSSAVTMPVLQRNRADIDWMEARLGQSLEEDLGACREHDVRGESDLLNPDPDTVTGLLGLLGDAAPAGVTGRTPEEVALLVHALRVRHERRSARAQREESKTEVLPWLGDLGRRAWKRWKGLRNIGRP